MFWTKIIVTTWLVLCECWTVSAVSADVDIDNSYQYWEIAVENSQRNSWPYLSKNRAVAIRTQRDVSTNVTVADNVVSGVSLSTVLFEPFGYNSSSLQGFSQLMDAGVQSFILDLYYNENSQSWLLCPKSTVLGEQSSPAFSECQNSDFNLTSVVSSMNKFIDSTDNELSINVMFLLLRLHSFSIPPRTNVSDNSLNSNITSLSDSISRIRRIVSPFSFAEYNLPTLGTLLSKYTLRVFPIIVENNLPSNSSYNLLPDASTLYLSSSVKNINTYLQTTSFNILDLQLKYHRQINCTESLVEDSSIKFSYDTEESPFTLNSYWNSIKCGYSPIINHAFKNIIDISTFLDISTWSWAPFQPTATGIDVLSYPDLLTNLTNRGLPNLKDLNVTFTTSSSDQDGYNVTLSDNQNSSLVSTTNSDGDDDQDQDDEYLNRCAVLTRLGWIATSCDRKIGYVCQNLRNSSDFIVVDDKKTYMNAVRDCQSLDGKYDLAAVRNVYEQYKLLSMMTNSTLYFWININSLSTENCWVVGLETDCPYQAVISHRIFIQLITPSSIMALLLFLLLVALQGQRLPVHKNRKHWKKLLNEKLKNEYDGIAS